MSTTAETLYQHPSVQRFITSLTLTGQSTEQDPAGPAVPGDVSGRYLQTPHLTVSHTASWVRKSTSEPGWRWREAVQLR